MPETYGAKPHPRALIHGFSSESPLGSFVEKVFPTHRYIEEDDLLRIRMSEWDLVVTLGGLSGLDSHLYIIQFGGARVGITAREPTSLMVEASGYSYATQFEIPDEPTSSIRAVVREALVPHVQEHAENLYWRFAQFTSSRWHQVSVEGRTDIQAFLRDGDGEILAGRLLYKSREIWWVPDVGTGHQKWLAVALEVWAERDGARFPVREEWRERYSWQTPEEVNARNSLQTTRTRLLSVISELRSQEQSLLAEIGKLSGQIDEKERKLLTAQGDELVDQVDLCLSELGFDVTNVDKEISTPGDRREDLRVKNPDGDWSAVAEVRGYTRGAQLNDLLRIGRFVTRYTKEIGEEPSASWYLVNQELKKDPDARQEPLAANGEEVATFAEGGGLVIDTRDLFRLLMAVRRGEIKKERARELLIVSVGRFMFPSTGTSA
ncbi:hypothetical protein [Streptomyces sp. SID4982]|uniref:hypothetical protein n=1 Tax=Streptomyces sp. SID4982 TaxID=2690291 RepID=UPI00136D31FA|nr:hypothetical protein [Streptomyces sp. SID4982]MYS12500.1 hypothetical protein [Streptomyces sp. SID4982]